MRGASNKIKRIKALQKRTDMCVQQLINESYKILNNPIIVYDFDWNILAYAEGVITDDPFWNSHINTGTADNNALGTYVNEGFVDIMTRPDSVVFLSSEKVKYNRYFGKIYDDNNIPIAAVNVVASNQPFEDDDLKATELLCKMLSKEIIKIPYYTNYSQKNLQLYINALIDEEVTDKLLFAACINIIYLGLKNTLFLAVADVAKSSPTYPELEYYRDLFKRVQPTYKYSIYSKYIIIIMSTDEKNLHPKRCFYRLNRTFKEHNIRVGVSSSFENLYELSGRYNEALTALNNGIMDADKQWLFIYDGEIRPIY